jgi:hypothetical protein
MRVWVAFILTLTLAGCLKTTDSVDPALLAADRESKLYVICFISPQDTILAAKVARSEPKIITTNEPSLVVETATVTLSDEKHSIVLPYNSAVGYYRAKPGGGFSIQPGQTYRLTVLMGENSQVTAQATVPDAVPIQRVQVDSAVTKTAINQSVLYTTTIFWNSPGGLAYYRGYGEFTQMITDKQGTLLETRINSPSFFVDRANSPDPNLRSLTGTHTVVLPLNAKILTKRARIELFTTDLNYYRYHATLREQINTPNNSFAESTVLFSNITGGYGVFAAYNTAYVTLP